MQWTIKRVNPGPKAAKTVTQLKKEGFDVYDVSASGITLLRRRADYTPPKKTSKKSESQESTNETE